MGSEPAAFDPARLLSVLDHHHVDYVLIGGLGARAYGAARQTVDVDVVPERSTPNLTRLALALQELGAHLRVEDDPEAETLKIPLDADTLANWQFTTWRTTAGDFDILANIPDRAGQRHGYDDLLQRANTLTAAGRPVLVAALEDIIASKQYANRAKDHAALPELEAIASRLADQKPSVSTLDFPVALKDALISTPPTTTASPPASPKPTHRYPQRP
jgi:hypothetical protein